MARTHQRPTSSTTRAVSLAILLDEEEYARVRAAATKWEQSVEEFVRTGILTFADEVIDDGPIGEPRAFRLSPRDSALLDQHLDSPAEPNEALLRAAQRYRDLLGD